MDLMKNLLDPNQSLKSMKVNVKSAPVKIIQKYVSDDEDELEDFSKKIEESRSTDYAKEYQMKEEDLYMECNKICTENDGEMSQVDHADDLLSNDGKEEISILKEEQLVEIYTKYSFNNYKTEELSIDPFRSKILSFIYANQVLIIQGHTGCGKSTQVPQFILDDCKANNKYCKIVVTQPRRIAAVSVAKRVCEERGWALGTVCGYQVGLEKCISNETLLMYVTTGVLLQKLVKQKNLHEFTHIIVDEVHERNQDMDFLLLIIRKFLYMSAANVKVILMSATIDTNAFAYYFRTPSRNAAIEAPVFNIPKQTAKYSNTVYYADQLKQLGEIPSFNICEPKIDPSLYTMSSYLVRALDRLDPISDNTKMPIIGNVLVFLPGILEIEEMHKELELKKNRTFKTDKEQASEPPTIKWSILPLHSSVTMEEQRKIFLPPQPGFRNIILSTNIAESSLTVPGITYVIDFCLTKTMEVDPHTQYQSLQLQWASQDNCEQRAGRVGRVGHGRVYRMVSIGFFSQFRKSAVPEMLRAPLDRIILAAKLLNLKEPPKAILALAMDPPELSNIESTIWNLKEAGGLLMTCNGRKMASDGDITFLGHVMANLPLDIHLSKFIVLGYMFSCMDDCIVIACGMSLNRIFSTPFMEYLKSYTNRLQWADGSSSDLIAYLNLYRVWQKMKRTTLRKKQDEARWAYSNYLSVKALKEWKYLVDEVRERVKATGMQDSFGPARVHLSPIELPIVLKVLICGAFYPNYFRRSADAGQVDEREAVKVLNGQNPFNTVYFNSFDPYQPGPLYAQRIKEIFTKNLITRSASSIKVTFDSSSKVYVSFINSKEPMYTVVDNQEFVSKMPGKIEVELYRAVRMRQLNVKTCIKVLKREESWKIAKKFGIDSESQQKGYVNLIKKNNELDQPILPSLHNKIIRIKISETINAGHFWAQYADDSSDHTLESIFNFLNKKKLKPANPSELNIGEIYATKYKVDDCFYRCKILEFKTTLGPKGKGITRNVKVIYIDYGNTAVVTDNELCLLPEETDKISPQAMECMLSEVQPSLVLNPRAIWTDQASRKFDHYTRDIVLTGQVYSVVNGVVHLELYRTNNFNQPSVNKWLIEKGFAQKAEESFLSKENHIKRIQAQSDEGGVLSAEDDDMYEKVIQDIAPPSDETCSVEIKLKGPFSPLEMKIYSTVASGIDKHVRIDGNSVNTVLLDTDPQDPHERLVVAAQVDQNASGNALILRHTTVMPNIHGFPMLMTLLFCPTMECKPTADGRKVAAVLCGLGAHEITNKSLYPPHDLFLILDTELTEEKLNMINEVRFWMNLMMSTMEDLHNETVPSVEIETCQSELKSRLFDLLKHPRKDTEREFVKYANIWGKLLYDAEQLKPGDDGYMMEDAIWPLHSFIRLNKEAEQQVELKSNLTEMEDMARRMTQMSTITCKACDIPIYSIEELRIHLTLENHKKNADKYA